MWIFWVEEDIFRRNRHKKLVEILGKLGYNIDINMTKERVKMKPIIRSSSDLRKNYNSIAEICRNSKEPVFLTRNGAGDTVIMDMETYSRREEDLATAERLLAAERARLHGTKGYTPDEFEGNMREAIARGSAHGE